jgi:NitT/TauT family transport system substrate-binding protein
MMLKQWRKSMLLTLAATLLLALVLSACGDTETGTKQDEAKADPIKIAYSPWPGWFFWDLVKEKGFFEKHDVEVELVWFPVYSDSLAALTTGQVDANSQTLSDTIAPLSKGIDLKAVLVNDNSNGGDAIVTKPDVQSIKDLKGKTVATELGTVDHFLLLTALEKNGMSEKDINYVNMTVNDAGPAFITGKVEAAVLWEPFQSTAVNEGKGKVLFSSKETPGLIPDLLVFKGETISERAADVQKIVDAWFDALSWYEQNQDEAIAIMAKKAEISPEEFKLSLDSIKLFSVDDNIKAFEKADSYDSLEYTGLKTAEFLKKLEMVTDIPDVSAALDGTFVKAAKQ